MKNNKFELNKEYQVMDFTKSKKITIKVLWLSSKSIKFEYEGEIVLRRIQKDCYGKEYINLH